MIVWWSSDDRISAQKDQAKRGKNHQSAFLKKMWYKYQRCSRGVNISIYMKYREKIKISNNSEGEWNSSPHPHWGYYQLLIFNHTLACYPSRKCLWHKHTTNREQQWYNNVRPDSTMARVSDSGRGSGVWFMLAPMQWHLCSVFCWFRYPHKIDFLWMYRVNLCYK